MGTTKYRRIFTAAYSMKAGKGGTAGDNEPLHIVELKHVAEKWISDGIALCGVHAEQRDGRLIAASQKGVEHATCKACVFHYAQSARTPSVSDDRDALMRQRARVTKAIQGAISANRQKKAS